MSRELFERIRERADDPTRCIGDDFVESYDRRPRYGPVAETVIADAERRLGFPLPPFLREVYLRVGNGGFGPGYGIMGLAGDWGDDDLENRTLVEAYALYHREPDDDSSWSWPEKLVPLANFGCAVRACVDCRTPAGRMVTFDPTSRQDGDNFSGLAESHPSIEAWFSDWVSGVPLHDVMFEDDPTRARTGANPFTGAPITFHVHKLRGKPY